MSIQVERAHGLEALGILRSGRVHWNLSPAALYEEALRRGEGILAAEGPLVCKTGQHTGRSPNDKFVVSEPSSERHVHWGNVNRPVEEAKFEALHKDMMAYLQDKDLYVLDAWAGTDTKYKLPIRVVNEFAWHNLFARNMFLPETDPAKRAAHRPEFTVIDAPNFKSDPTRHGTRSDVFVFVHFGKKVVLIGGTHYAGEIKKSIFTILNYTLPLQGVLSMHCSANIGKDGDTALFFGLSGTGKTTLSADPERRLIGDDEHGWSDRGVFNIEGGCYAKCIKLSQEGEPQIWNAIRFGSVLENVVLDPVTRVPDYDSAAKTENTRVTYPVSYIPGAVIPSVGGHPKNVIFLTADAFGVLPPVSKLSREQAQYYFINGYTSKLAGTEAGVTEPTPNFSACFGGPFLPRPPMVYADMLAKKIDKHGLDVWLLNTGWTGGAYGVGGRFKLAYTRAFVTAILNGSLRNVKFETHPIFGLQMPTSAPGVPDEVLNPRNTWKDKAAYDEKAKQLAKLFRENDGKFKIAERVRA